LITNTPSSPRERAEDHADEREERAQWMRSHFFKAGADRFADVHFGVPEFLGSSVPRLLSSSATEKPSNHVIPF
jgi:hypothetical protein